MIPKDCKRLAEAGFPIAEVFAARGAGNHALKDVRKAARLAPTLREKLERQRAVRTLEGKREDAWRAYDQASREIDQQKDALLDEIGRRLDERMEHATLFTLRWELA